jgi:hypothetical protein
MPHRLKPLGRHAGLRDTHRAKERSAGARVDCFRPSDYPNPSASRSGHVLPTAAYLLKGLAQGGGKSGAAGQVEFAVGAV